MVSYCDYTAIGLPNARFYIAMKTLDATGRAILRKPLFDAFPLPTVTNPRNLVYVSAFQSIFFRQLSICHSIGEKIDDYQRRDIRPSDCDWADLCRPLLLLEKLKDATEAHQHYSKGEEGDPFSLSPHLVQDAFARQVPGYPKMVDDLKTAWLAPTRPQSDPMRFVSPAAKDAVSWLYVRWRGSLDGKGGVGVDGLEEKKQWLLKRQREVQDTKNWAIWLVDPETRNRHPSQRPMKAALQHEVPYHLRPL
ncbi:hypothetical protein JCM6882_003233 [Rhodosporidiobolus microsporus]